MRLFLAEMKKIWNWRILAVLVLLGGLTYVGILRPVTEGMDSFIHSGANYMLYKHEMYLAYGDTLEPDELADFNFPAKKAELNILIKEKFDGNPLFARYGITTLEQWQKFQDDTIASMPSDTDGPFTPTQPQTDLYDMMSYVYSGEEMPDSAAWRLSELLFLEDRYRLDGVSYEQERADLLQAEDLRPVVRRQAAEFKFYPNNLIDQHLPYDFSNYAAVVAVASIVAVALLVSPLMAEDRSRRMNLLQYSSHYGRVIVRTQFLATLISSALLSGVCTALGLGSYVLGSGAYVYWGAHIFNMEGAFWMYNITFGAFVLLCGGMGMALSLGVGCLAFVLSLHSPSLVTMFVKVIPVAAAMSAIAGCCIYVATSADNVIFNWVGRGYIDWPEVWLVAILAIVALVLGMVMVRRQRTAAV